MMPSYPIEEITDVTPLERFYQRNPDELSDADLAEIVELHRAERTKLAEKRTRKAAKKSKGP